MRRVSLCHVTLRDSQAASPHLVSWSWLARLKCAYNGVKTLSGKIQIRTILQTPSFDTMSWSWIFLLPAAFNVFIYTFQFSCWITQVTQGWHGSIIHRWKHPDVASSSVHLLYLAHFRPDLMIVGTALLMSSLCYVSLVSLTLASADHMPIYGTLWLPGRVYNGRCGRDQWWWPLGGNFTITCHGTWLLARTTANWADKTLAIAQSWPPPRPP